MQAAWAIVGTGSSGESSRDMQLTPCIRESTRGVVGSRGNDPSMGSTVVKGFKLFCASQFVKGSHGIL